MSHDSIENYIYHDDVSKEPYWRLDVEKVLKPFFPIVSYEIEDVKVKDHSAESQTQIADVTCVISTKESRKKTTTRRITLQFIGERINAATFSLENAKELQADGGLTEETPDVTTSKNESRLSKTSKPINSESGLMNKVELNYSIGLGETEDVIFQNYGYKQFKSLNPIEARYSIGYRFNDYFSLSAGIGFLYETKSLTAVGDIFDEDVYGVNINDEYCSFSVPVFLNTDIFLTTAKCQPMLSLSGGIYLSSPFSDMGRGLSYLADGGIGCNFRINDKRSFYILASAGLIPQHRFVEEMSGGSYMKSSQASIRIKVGFIL